MLEIDGLIGQPSHWFHELFHGLPVACFFFDGDGLVQDWNRASEALYQRPASEVLQKPLWEIVCGPDGAGFLRTAAERVLAGETLEDLDWTSIRSDGCRIDTLSCVFPVRTPDGSVVGGVMANVDITGRKVAERALQENNENLDIRIHERTAQLAGLNESLRREVAERKRAEAALRKEADRLSAVVNVQYEIARAELDLERVMRLICTRTCELSRADRCLIWLLDGEELVCRAGTGDMPYPVGARLTTRQNFAGHCVETGEIVYCPDTLKNPNTDRDVALATKSRSLAGVPIHFGGRVVGTFVVVSKKARFFDESVIQILQLMAGLVSTAMEHSTQFQERREAERELQRILAQTEQVLLAIPSALIEIDEKGSITTWNAAAKAAFGISRDDALGKRLEECAIGWDAALLARSIEISKSQVQEVRLEDVQVSQPGGKDRLLSVTITPITTGVGAPTGLLILAVDVTERRSLESQLSHAQKLESIGHLAAGIAHEINTPIQYVGDNIRFLQDAFRDMGGLIETLTQFIAQYKGAEVPVQIIGTLEDAVVKADVEYLLREAPAAIAQSLEGVQRVAHIVGAMKEFSHPGTSEKTPIDLNHALESTITVARNEWKYVAEVVTDFDPDLPLVDCLPADLNQVFLNLLVNAAHAVAEVVREGTGQKGIITVRTRRGTDCVEVSISDTGPGVPPEIRSRIFDPFFTTKCVGKGTGQGLTIARSVVVDKHEGTIEFDTQMGQGTTFIVRLPLRKGMDVPAAA